MAPLMKNGKNKNPLLLMIVINRLKNCDTFRRGGRKKPNIVNDILALQIFIYLKQQ
jgi:hypothetical protein